MTIRLEDLPPKMRAVARAALEAERARHATPRPPTLRALHGAAPDLTGGRSAEAYVRQLRDAAPDALVFVLPMPPALLSRAHRASTNGRVIAREKRGYYAALDERQAAGLIPPPPPVPFARARLSAVMTLGGMMDEENAAARAYKFPCDWLQSRGYIVNDRPTCLTRDGYPTQRVTRREPPALVLTLSPLAP
jgi:hypothetical protein